MAKRPNFTGGITAPYLFRIDTSTILHSHATITIKPIPLAAGSAQLISTSTLTNLGGSFRITSKVTNRGIGTAQKMWLTNVTLAGAVGSAAPQSLFNIPQNDYAMTSVDSLASVGNSGVPVIENLTALTTVALSLAASERCCGNETDSKRRGNFYGL